MTRIAERLRALGHDDLRRIDWPGAPAKGDAADFQGNNDELRELIWPLRGSLIPLVIPLAATAINPPRPSIRPFPCCLSARS